MAPVLTAEYTSCLCLNDFIVVLNETFDVETSGRGRCRRRNSCFEVTCCVLKGVHVALDSETRHTSACGVTILQRRKLYCRRAESLFVNRMPALGCFHQLTIDPCFQQATDRVEWPVSLLPALRGVCVLSVGHTVKSVRVPPIGG